MVGGATQFQASLAQYARDGGRAEEVAARAVTVWRAIDAVLAPIIGHGGVAALFERSLHLACTPHPALVCANDAAASPGDFSALQTALAGFSSADAASANGELLRAFDGLLTGLIGQPLVDRLLQPVWDTLHSGDPAKDDAP